MRRSSLGGGGQNKEKILRRSKYLVSPPVLQASKAEKPFKMYIAL
jgi:hypothetical protein